MYRKRLMATQMTLKRLLTAILLQYTLALPMQAQTVIEGNVTDSLHRAVDAYVTVAPTATASILDFADTDAKGHYRLSFSTAADSLVVTAAGLGIGQQVRTVPNRSQRVDFSVRQQAVQLKEVSVRAKKIDQQGDTVNYSVATYKEQGDRVIGDVLRRMPGIEVTDGGSIKYNGKAIKRFYVEEMDLLQGRYGIATNNINADDVARVQVLEHHQDKKMLQGKTLTDDVAINLKLKDGAKGTVAVNAMAGGGWGDALIWKGELIGMYFGRNRQNMTLYKGNNSGDDISQELASHYGINSVPLYPFCPVGAILPSGAGLPSKRTLDNRSHIVSMNHLERLTADKEVTFNIGYHNDHIRREGTSLSDRFVSDTSRLLTEETLTSTTTLHNLSAQARYCNNSSTAFMANVLQINAGWNKDDVLGQTQYCNFPSLGRGLGEVFVHQHFRRPSFSISNTFNTTQNIGRNMFDLYFSVGYAQRPNTLSVGIDSLHEGTSARYVQDLTSRHIAARFNTGFTLRVGTGFKFNYGISASANLHGITTDLDGASMLKGQRQNDLWYNTYNIALGQSYKYETYDFSVTLGLPLELYTQRLDDHVRKDNHTYTHLLFAPSLSMNWAFDRHFNLSASATYNKTVGDPGGIYSGYIMSNYRTFQRSYVEQLSETKNYGASANLRYRNALQAVFANASFSFRRSEDNQIYGYTYEGATSVVQAVNQPTTHDTFSLGGEVSKGFDFWRSSIRLFGNYSLSKSERLIADNLYQYHAQAVSFGGGLTFSPFEWMGIVYSSGFSFSRSEAEGQREHATLVRSNTQRLSMNLYPTKTFTLTLAAEDNYTNLTAENRHAWFADASAKLKLKRIELELQLNNLFNQRRYTRVTYSGLDIYTQTTQLQPMSAVLSIRFKLL